MNRSDLTRWIRTSGAWTEVTRDLDTPMRSMLLHRLVSDVIRAATGEAPHVAPAASSARTHPHARARVLAALTARPSTPQEVRAATGLSFAAIEEALSGLGRMGIAKRTGGDVWTMINVAPSHLGPPPDDPEIIPPTS